MIIKVNIKLLLFWSIATYYTSILNHWVYVTLAQVSGPYGTYGNDSTPSLVHPS